MTSSASVTPDTTLGYELGCEIMRPWQRVSCERREEMMRRRFELVRMLSAALVLAILTTGQVDAVELSGGDIVVTDLGLGGASITCSLIVVDPMTGIQSFIVGPTNCSTFSPRGLAIDGNGDIIVTDITINGFSGGISRVDPDTGTISVISSGGFLNFDFDPFRLVIDSNGDFVVALQGANQYH